jgi:hypothetical protein
MLDLALPTDFKEVMIHVEAGNETLHVSGTVPGSTTARITDSGVSCVLPISASAGSAVARIAAPSGVCDVSVFAWR